MNSFLTRNREVKNDLRLTTLPGAAWSLKLLTIDILDIYTAKGKDPTLIV